MTEPQPSSPPAQAVAQGQEEKGGLAWEHKDTAGSKPMSKLADRSGSLRALQCGLVNDEAEGFGKGTRVAGTYYIQTQPKKGAGRRRREKRRTR